MGDDCNQCVALPKRSGSSQALLFTSPYCKAVPLPNSPPAAASYLFKSARAMGAPPRTSAADKATAAPALCRRAKMGVLSWALADTAVFAEGRCGHAEADKQTGRVVRDTAGDIGKSCIAPTPLPQSVQMLFGSHRLSMQLANNCSVGKIADWPGRFLKTWSAPRQPYFLIVTGNFCIGS